LITLNVYWRFLKNIAKPCGRKLLCLNVFIIIFLGFKSTHAQKTIAENNIGNSNAQARIGIVSQMPSRAEKNSPKEIFYYWFKSGQVLNKEQNWFSARNAFEEAYKVSTRVSDSAQINTLLLLGEVNTQLIEYTVAFQQLSECALIAERSHRYFEAQLAFKLLGDVFTKSENYALALINYKKSWSITNSYTPLELRVQFLCRLTEASMKLNKNEEASQYINEAEGLVESKIKPQGSNFENTVLLINVLKSKSKLQVQLNDTQSALKSLEDAGKLCEKIKDDLLKTDILLEESEILNRTDNSELAITKIAEFQKTLHNNLLLARTKICLGDIFFNRKNWNAAQSHFEFAEKNLVGCCDTFLLQHVAHQLFLSHLNLNNAANAKKYFSSDTTLQVTTHHLENKQREESIKLNFNNTYQENALSTLKMRDNRFLLIFGSIGAMLLVVLLSLILQNRTKNYNQLMLRNAEIQSQNKKLEESNEILTQFAYVAAHDLKEPLRSIGSYIGILQIKYLKDLPPAASEYMQFINSGVKRMYLLLNDLLELSQVIRQQPGAEVVRPEEVLNDVRANLNSAIELKHAQLEYTPNMPGVRMNRNHLIQLFQNLIGNALKFTNDQPRVRVYATEELSRIIFTVEDNGIGIKKDYSSKIFVLFQQLNKKGSYEGTGIGLTICKNIVEKYNGTIWFESEENVGTKFHFSIPV